MNLKTTISFLFLALLTLSLISAEEGYSLSEQSYRVVYDKQGDAAAMLLLKISNNRFDDGVFTSFSFEATKEIEIIKIIERKPAEICKNICVEYAPNATKTFFGKNIEDPFDPNSGCIQSKRECKEDQDYRNSDYRLINTELIRKTDGTYTFVIEPLSPGKSTELLLIYRIKDATEGNSIKRFDFQTLAFDMPTDKAQVLISLEKGLIFKEDAKIPLFSSRRGIASISELSSTASIRDLQSPPFSLSLENPQNYESLFRSIGYYEYYGGKNSISKQYFSPKETLSIEGEYSYSNYILLSKEIALFFLLTSLLLFFSYTWLKKLHRKEEEIASKKIPANQYSRLRALGIGVGAFGVLIFFFFLSKLSANYYFKAIFLSLAICFFFSSYLYAKIFHSTKEMLVSIGFTFIATLLLPFLFLFVFFSYSILLNILPQFL